MRRDQDYCCKVYKLISCFPQQSSKALWIRVSTDPLVILKRWQDAFETQSSSLPRSLRNVILSLIVWRPGRFQQRLEIRSRASVMPFERSRRTPHCSMTHISLALPGGTGGEERDESHLVCRAIFVTWENLDVIFLFSALKARIGQRT